MSGLTGNPGTDANGYYTGTVNYGWTGTVTPTKTGYTFNPPSTSYSNVTSNQSTNYTGAGVAKTIALTSGNAQTGVISTALVQPYVVTVTDAGGNPVTGTSVTFAIGTVPTSATGQTLSTTTTTTNSSGQASTTLTLGNKTGSYTVTTTSTGLTGSPVTFTSTATAGTAKTIALTSGNTQTGVISTALVQPYVVTVTDAGGNPVTGTSVTFAIGTVPTSATGQTLSTTTTTTNSSGQASTTLTLGNKTGSYTVTTTIDGIDGIACDIHFNGNARSCNNNIFNVREQSVRCSLDRIGQSLRCDSNRCRR